MNAVTSRHIRRIILEQSRRAHVGHIGCCLCVVEILQTLLAHALRPATADDPDRDRLILAKGHAALALYAVWHALGRMDAATLNTFCADGSRLGVHPECGLPGVDFATGSLGHGLSYGVGAALAARLQRSQRRIFVLMSDAECNEGAVWEAAAFAAHHRLANLTAIIDANGQQALGPTRQILNPEPMTDRWAAFGWHPVETDGHSLDGLASAIAPCGVSDKPRVVIARTVFGKGVSFMEGQLKWHYWPMNDAEFAQAMREIGAT